MKFIRVTNSLYNIQELIRIYRTDNNIYVNTGTFTDTFTYNTIGEASTALDEIEVDIESIINE